MHITNGEKNPLNYYCKGQHYIYFPRYAIQIRNRGSNAEAVYRIMDGVKPCLYLGQKGKATI